MAVGSTFWEQISTVALAVVGVAILAVVVSKNSNTSSVIQASSQAFTSGLSTALSPIVGSGSAYSTFPIG